MKRWKPKEEEAYFYIEFEYADMTGKTEIFVEYWGDLFTRTNVTLRRRRK
jgi:hypothetical protein